MGQSLFLALVAVIFSMVDARCCSRSACSYGDVVRLMHVTMRSVDGRAWICFSIHPSGNIPAIGSLARMAVSGDIVCGCVEEDVG